MRIFLDSSVLHSACGSGRSLSRLIMEIADDRAWHLISASYCYAETRKNIRKLGGEAVLRSYGGRVDTLVRLADGGREVGSSARLFGIALAWWTGVSTLLMGANRVLVKPGRSKVSRSSWRMGGLPEELGKTGVCDGEDSDVDAAGEDGWERDSPATAWRETRQLRRIRRTCCETQQPR